MTPPRRGARIKGGALCRLVALLAGALVLVAVPTVAIGLTWWQQTAAAVAGIGLPVWTVFKLVLLGRRRGWMLVTQLVLLAAIPLFGALDPKAEIWSVVALSTIVAFFFACSTYSPILSNARLSITAPMKLRKSWMSPIVISSSMPTMRSRTPFQIDFGT